MRLPSIDVRDCADAHLQSVLREEAHGHRFILVGESCWMTEMGDYLHEAYGNNGYPSVSRNLIWRPLLWIASWFMTDAGAALTYWGLDIELDNKPVEDILGIKFTPIKTSLQEMALAMIKSGYVPD